MKSIPRRTFLKGTLGAGYLLAAESGLNLAWATTSDVIVNENALAGSNSYTPSYDDAIEGFATAASVNAGERIEFKIRTPATAYHIDIYRLGWYQGHGARKVTTIQPTATLPQPQDDPIVDEDVRMTDAGNWSVSAGWDVPASAVSGVYVAQVVREDESGKEDMIFVVRNDGRETDLLFQTSDTTRQAYNVWGGTSLYVGPDGRAYKVSYNRPERLQSAEKSFFNAENPMLRWLERNGYDVAYCTGVDTARDPSLLLDTKVFLSVGHDEYWAGSQRDNVEAALDAGVHLIFLSGNEVYWKVRWEPSIDASETPGHTMVCYKETHAGAKIDPTAAWTGTWRDPRFSPPADGGRSEQSLIGQIFTSILNPSAPPIAIEVPAAYGQMRLWRNTDVATLAPGQKVALTLGTLGHEFGEDLDTPDRPAGVIRLSETTLTVQERIRDYGSVFLPGESTHSLTLYRHASGALVFGAGTIQFAWALDTDHIRGDDPPQPRAQQAMINLLADMGTQPATLQSGLVAATASTDTTPPTSVITSPAEGATDVVVGQAYEVQGTASDVGGEVAGVEVSFDGERWHPATGRETWAYQWTPKAPGTVTIRSRAVDDSVNLEAPGSGVTVEVQPPSMPVSIWPASTVPATIDSADGSAIELGVKFRATTDGFVNGIRFYKAAANTGPHVGKLYTEGGTLLESRTFSDETTDGWQEVTFDRQVPITADEVYVAAYHTASGRFSLDSLYFSTDGAGNWPLRALRSGGDAGGNGVYRYGTLGFPTQTHNASNYWVDVVFDNRDTRAAAVLERNPTDGSLGVSDQTTVRAVFSEPIEASSLVFTLTDDTETAVPADVAYDAETNTAVLTPNAPLAAATTFTAAITDATDTAGNPLDQPITWTFATRAANELTLWDSTVVPATAAANDGNAVELGVKFTSDIDGVVAGVRFYKGTGNTGTHTAKLWTAGGEELATATFASETTEGWQQVFFAEAVPIDKDTTYVVSYHAPNGRYAVNGAYFNGNGQHNPPLHAPATSTVGGNGVYGYGPSGFPTDTYNAGNYWVDVILRVEDVRAPRVAVAHPADGSVAISEQTTVRAVFSEAIEPSSLAFALTDEADAPVPADVSYDAETNTAILTPNAPLDPVASYTAAVTAATDLAGNSLADPVTWSFTTRTANELTLWDSTAVPANPAASDGSAVELGVKFTSDIDGAVTGLRFYKGTGNNGTHVARLWTAGGTQLASATFTSETSHGWQHVSFDDPVPVDRNTVYIASYHAPNGHYAVNTGYFNGNGQHNPPLHAPASGTVGGNGVYRYGSGGVVPSTASTSNYWIDVVVDGSDTRGPKVVDTTPNDGATGVEVNAVRAVFNESIQASSLTFTLTDATDTPVAGDVAYDNGTKTATFTPTASLAAGTTYTATVSGATDTSGNAMTAPVTWSFTTRAGNEHTLWNSSVAPANPAVSEGSAVELGVKFTSDIDGEVTGIRFYKGAGNTGTHTATLWNASGTALATATFTGETSQGWQQVSFDAPVPVTQNTVYVASYHAPNGHYALDSGYFSSSAYNKPPLRAPATGAAGGNGVYRYGSGGTMPASSYNGGNYWVDVVFREAS